MEVITRFPRAVREIVNIDIPLSDGSSVPVLNCGTSGQTHDPHRNRSASAGLYHVQDNKLVAIERFMHDGERFVLEVGGAFTSGR